MFHSRRNQSRATGPPNHPLREKVTLQSAHTTLMEGRTTSRHSGIMKKKQKKQKKKTKIWNHGRLGRARDLFKDFAPGGRRTWFPANEEFLLLLRLLLKRLPSTNPNRLFDSPVLFCFWSCLHEARKDGRTHAPPTGRDTENQNATAGMEVIRSIATNPLTWRTQQAFISYFKKI